ncbi:hypothetical protein GYMLUDRAFT_594111 [Collybiopsis luxurians FD-317 M1]|uniref:Uncharacterized protein n=1 Tax=Collybiopsis luxurians FD-317 M1 TaxID=944289 RepID=A0A0D0BW95_9AGAR|nr:hypothetical protein GYMLUDRAFT_594111 [Collybiopsis luxurians FD-317 M1]
MNLRKSLGDSLPICHSSSPFMLPGDLNLSAVLQLPFSDKWDPCLPFTLDREHKLSTDFISDGIGQRDASRFGSLHLEGHFTLDIIHSRIFNLLGDLMRNLWSPAIPLRNAEQILFCKLVDGEGEAHWWVWSPDRSEAMDGDRVTIVRSGCSTTLEAQKGHVRVGRAVCALEWRL